MKERKERQRRATAYHEAGHVVAAYRLGYRVTKATIVPTGHYDGIALHANPLYRKNIEWDNSPRTQRLIEHSMMIAIAGPIANKHHAPRSHWRKGAADDFRHYADLLFRHHADAKVRDKYQEYIWTMAEAFVAQWWTLIDKLARVLLERETMTREEISEVLDPPLPRFKTVKDKNGVLKIYPDEDGGE